MGIYTKKIKKMRWSFSRVNSFGNCPYQWYLEYLLRDDNGKRIYEREDNFYAAFGHFCHELLESILRNTTTVDEAYIKYQEEFDEKMASFYVKESTKEKYFYLGLDYFGDLDFGWLEDYEILGIEKKVNFKIGKYSFIGYIDLLIRDKKTGDIIIIDHKSSEYPIGKRGGVLKNHQNSYESYKKQLYLYGKAVREEYGQVPKKIVWNYFKEKKWLDLPFIQSECDEALRWAEGNVERIIEEEEFPAKLDYFYCSNLCSYRSGACEYRVMGGE